MSATLARTCTLPGCDNPHRARGLCSAHYLQLRRREGYRRPVATDEPLQEPPAPPIPAELLTALPESLREMARKAWETAPTSVGHITRRYLAGAEDERTLRLWLECL